MAIKPNKAPNETKDPKLILHKITIQELKPLVAMGEFSVALLMIIFLICWRSQIVSLAKGQRPTLQKVQELPSVRFIAGYMARYIPALQLFAGIAVVRSGQEDAKAAIESGNPDQFYLERIGDVTGYSQAKVTTAYSGTPGLLLKKRYAEFQSILGSLQSSSIYSLEKIFVGINPSNLEWGNVWTFFIKISTACGLTTETVEANIRNAANAYLDDEIPEGTTAQEVGQLLIARLVFAADRDSFDFDDEVKVSSNSANSTPLEEMLSVSRSLPPAKREAIQVPQGVNSLFLSGILTRKGNDIEKPSPGNKKSPSPEKEEGKPVKEKKGKADPKKSAKPKGGKKGDS